MSASGKTIPVGSSSYRSISRSPFSTSYLATSPLAQQAIARDIEEWSDEEHDDEHDAPGYEESSSDEESELSIARRVSQSHSLTSTYQRPSIAYGSARSTVTQLAESNYLTKKEKRDIKNQERSLLRDNYLAPPKHGEQPPPGRLRKVWKYLFGTRRPRDEEAANGESSETSALLAGGVVETARERSQRENRIWEDAVAAGQITTTWRREAKVLGQYSGPLVVTFLLQYSLTVASIFTVGHIGKIELGAVSCKYIFSHYAVIFQQILSLDRQPVPNTLNYQEYPELLESFRVTESC